MKSKNNPEESGAKPAMTERKMSLQNVRFCSLLAIFATAIIFFCFLYFIGEIRSFVYSIFVFCGLVSALIIFRRKTPNVVRSIFTSIVVGLSLFFLLNFTFTDGTPTEVYEGHFVSKFHGISTERGATMITIRLYMRQITADVRILAFLRENIMKTVSRPR